MIVNLLPDYSTGLTHAAWNKVGAGTAHGCLSTDDADTTYIWADTTPQYQDVKTSLWPSAIGLVNSIKVTAKIRDATDPVSVDAGIENAGGATTNNFVTTGGYVLETTAALARPGGGIWTAADCARDTTWWHIKCVNGANPDRMPRCTYGYIILDYTPRGGGFAFLIVSLVGAMLGANLMLSDMPGIAREVAREGISIIQPSEFSRCLAELRAHPFRAWSL